MPRQANPELEAEIIRAALRILDRGGDAAITLRAVARQAETTTPTIYERFRDREALMRGVVDAVTQDVMTVLQPALSVEAMFREFLAYTQAHPMRMGLIVTTFGARYSAGEGMPALELLKVRLGNERRTSRAVREDVALAIAALAIGTAQGMIAAGSQGRHATQMQRAAQQTLRRLLAALPKV
jgi:AcrR family transcriptional regulator